MYTGFCWPNLENIVKVIVLKSQTPLNETKLENSRVEKTEVPIILPDNDNNRNLGHILVHDYPLEISNMFEDPDY